MPERCRKFIIVIHLQLRPVEDGEYTAVRSRPLGGLPAIPNLPGGELSL
jgi:hypothetical protein